MVDRNALRENHGGCLADLYADCGYSRQEASRRTGIPVSTLQNWFTDNGLTDRYRARSVPANVSAEQSRRSAADSRGSVPPASPAIRSEGVRSAPRATESTLRVPEIMHGDGMNAIEIAFPGRVVVLSDIHFPYHDADAVAWALDVAQGAGTIVVNGDLVDFYSISKYNPDPRRSETLQDEIDMAVRFLVDLRRRNELARILYCIGNHEQRLEKFLRTRATALESLRCLDLDQLLRLSALGIESYGREGVVIDGVRYKHGDAVRKKAGDTAHAELMNHWRSGVSGHVHRRAKVEVRKDDRMFFWIEAGCLCKLEAEYVSFPDWGHAVAVVEDGVGRIEVPPRANGCSPP